MNIAARFGRGKVSYSRREWVPRAWEAMGRFVAQAAKLIERADISGVAAFYGIPRKTFERGYYQWLKRPTKLSEEENAEPIRSLGVNELSLNKTSPIRRGHH